ncbi:MAG: Hsp20/alpha crystallin family protein [Desulfobacterales bacterium]|nr:Hsp20/alpha crystallin family protein [Desulfobacterales bacterium]
MNSIEIRCDEEIEDAPRKERSLEDMFQSVSPMFCPSRRVWKPQMDIFETREKIIIHAEIAGVKKSDILIEVSSKAVKISGKRKSIKPPKNKSATYRLAEIQFGDFERVLYLPTVVDAKSILANFSNGFLEIKMEKSQDSGG